MKGAENVIAQIGGTGSRNLADYIDGSLIDGLRAHEHPLTAFERNTGKRLISRVE